MRENYRPLLFTLLFHQCGLVAISFQAILLVPMDMRPTHNFIVLESSKITTKALRHMTSVVPIPIQIYFHESTTYKQVFSLEPYNYYSLLRPLNK